MSQRRSLGIVPATIGLLNNHETDCVRRDTSFWKPVVHGLASTHDKMDAMTMG